MNKFVLKTLSTVALVGALSTSAVADEPQFGLGVGVAGQDSTTIRGTITLDDDMRLEPFFGFGYIDGDSTSSTNVSIGSALHIVKPINAKISAYYGGFAGIYSTDTDYTVGTVKTSISSTNFQLGPVAGVEYAFDKQFTLGAEVSFNLGFGDDTVIGTNSAVLLRYYFN
jgi:hypothetical protein